MFSLRIVTTDYRMDKPIAGFDVRVSDFRNSPVHKVPIIRIFGSTPLGQKACLCLHGIFPYLYVTLDSTVPPNHHQLQQFAASVDQALNVALGRTASSSQHVYKVTVVSGIPFYGYHAKECLFLKIFLYNPFMVKKVADLLLAGAIMNRSFQPHETHIPYVLQMFMDYNLFGMNFIHLSDVKFRLPVPPSDLQWNSVSVASDLVCPEMRSTSCELEVDAHACSILNREELSGKMAGNPGLLALWQEERMRCQRNNLESQLTPPLTPERCPLLIYAEQKLKTQLLEMLNSWKEEAKLSPDDGRKPLNETFTEDNSEAVICEKTILEVVSHSENFVEESVANNSVHLCDSSFANLLASLATERGSTQKVKNVVEMEEWDSVLSQNVQLKAEDRKMAGGNGDGDNDGIDEDDITSLEMSQCFDPESPRGFEESRGQTSKKHKLTSDDQNEVRKIKKLKTESTPLSTRKLMRIKSHLLKRQRYKLEIMSEKQNILDKKLEFTSIKPKDTMFRLKSSEVLVVDRIPADADEVVEATKVNEDSKPAKNAKLFSDLIRNLKDKVDKIDKVTNSSDSPQHDALEGLAFLSSPDSSSSLCSSFSDPNLTLLNDSSRILGSPSEVEDETTLMEQQELKKDASKVHSVSCLFDASRGGIEEGRTRSSVARRTKRTDHLRNLRKIEAKYPPLGYFDVEKDILCGRFKSAVTIRLRNAEKIFEKKEVLLRRSEQLVLHPGFVRDLTEHDNYGLAFGLTDLKQTLKVREELSGTSSKKPNKVKTKHILAPFLNVDNMIHIVPKTSPPTFDSVLKTLNPKLTKNRSSSEDVPLDSVQNNEPKNIKNPLVSSHLPQRDDFSTPQLTIHNSRDLIATHSKKICSSTPFLHSVHPSLPVNLDITPIAKTPTNISLVMDLSDNKTNKSVTLPVAEEHKETKKILPMNIVNRIKKFESQIEAATPANVFNFKVDSQNLQQLKSSSENQYLCIISLELHITTRGQLNPDPEYDGIVAAFYHISDERPHISGTRLDDSTDRKESIHSNERETKREVEVEGRSVTGVFLLLDPSSRPSISLREDVRLNFCRSEMEVIGMVVDLVKRHDADILVGYEIQKLSWGYLIQRAATMDVFLSAKLSRFDETDEGSKKKSKFQKDQTADQNEDILHSSEVFVPGRIVLNLWRILRHQVSLNIYTFENIAFHVLHQRIPHFSFQVLTFWFNHKNQIHRWKTIDYYVMRCRGNIQFMEQLDIVGQTSEFARIYGIEFFDVLNRGSQYRVESMMLRLAKPQNFIAVSPSVQQRAAMRSPECIPLNLEPRSDFYTDPVVVLDFQSLYPSIMIAYNYCFSTCLGRMKHFSKAKEGPFEFGCTSLSLQPNLLESLKDDINICSNGVVFVKSSVRKGILPSMVEEILNTRLMVKKAMKIHKSEKGLQRILHSRQLGLKLIANVTFGYTSANFSGRMACVEVGDSIMRKARDTLEAAISLVEKNSEWGAEVVYGDTDSMFVLLRGRSKDQAFRIGQEIAEAVTRSNPKPVKLKLEKVYMPCILQTKKRYVGFMYESPDQKEPIFDAKGIETVRRDNCPVVSKILEKSLKTLFLTCDLNLVKVYIQKQCIKVLDGRTPIQDFIFAKEYRGMARYQPNACIPALEIARQRLLRDRRSEPLVGERVPYVIVYGAPNQPLIKLVREPNEVLEDGTLRINSTYYLLKQVLPAVNRFTMLFRVEAVQWFHDMPRTLKLNAKLFDCPTTEQNEAPKNNLNQYFSGGDCLVCGESSSSDLCAECRSDDQKRLLFLSSQVRKSQAQLHEARKVCTACKGWQELDDPCNSLDCPIFFKRVSSTRASMRTEALLSKLQDL